MDYGLLLSIVGEVVYYNFKGAFNQRLFNFQKTFFIEIFLPIFRGFDNWNRDLPKNFYDFEQELQVEVFPVLPNFEQVLSPQNKVNQAAEAPDVRGTLDELAQDGFGGPVRDCLNLIVNYLAVPNRVLEIRYFHFVLLEFGKLQNILPVNISDSLLIQIAEEVQGLPPPYFLNSLLDVIIYVVQRKFK